MSTRGQMTDYAVAQFITDVKEILREQGAIEAGLEKIAERMRTLSTREDLLEEGKEIPAGNAFRERRLYLEPDNSLVLDMGEFRKSQPTPEISEIHGHGTWDVLCGYRGREHYALWERTDNAECPGYAQLRQLEYTTLSPGVATFFLGPPADIHDHDPIDESFWIIALFGNNASRGKRFYFTPEWRVREAVPGLHRQT